jgi:homoserine trans-succinylase
MGHVKNHLATLVSGAFALVLTGLYFPLVNFAPQLSFVFTMAVPIMWFMVFICWIAQKAADYNHGDPHSHDEKKNHELTPKEITTYKLNLEKDLSDISAKDDEIAHLKKEIENLKTKVEIESIRAEIYSLKMLAQQK